MNSNVGRRLEKLEQFHGNREKRLFVIRRDTEERRKAYVAGLISSGEATPTDTFIYTGVPRPECSHTDHGSIPDVLDHIAKHGRAIHEPRD
jgi:hypothetical protein